MRFPRPILWFVALLVLVTLQLVGAVSASAAAEYAAPESYAATCPMAASGTFHHNGGGRDAAGRLYMVCSGTSILVVEPTGTTRKVAISHWVPRVAPSPTGAYLYTIDSSARRFNRQADGNYVLDTTFKFQLPPIYAQRNWPLCGGGIATDGYGDIYLSTGGWCTSGNMILKYAPDGTFLTGFGDYGASAHWTFRINGTGAVCVPGSPDCLQSLVRNDVGSNPGKFQVNMMVAVTADSSRIWVADNNNMRVQWFNRTASGAYAFGGMWSGEGAMHADSVGSTYGIAVDPWGYAYVATTTRCQVWRLDPNGTNPVLVAAPACNQRDHALAVDALGTVWVGEWGMRIRRTSPRPGAVPALPPKPVIDLIAPVLSAVTAEATETSATTVRVTITARDANGIAQMRTRGASGDIEAATWGAYTQSFELSLPTLGYNELYVQVRDAAENSSNTVHLVVRRIPVPDAVAPVVRVTAPATTTAQIVTLDVDAADAVGVTHLRIAGDDGNWGPWLPWSNGVRGLQHDLAAKTGSHTLTVEVKDASHNISAPAVVTVAFVIPVAPVTPPVAGGGGAAAPGVIGPARDTVAPRIRSVRIPARTCSRLLTIRLAATDNVGLYWVRVANEDGRYGKWQRYRASLRHTLTRGATRKLVTVQVADAAGNVSRAMSVRTTVVRCGR